MLLRLKRSRNDDVRETITLRCEEIASPRGDRTFCFRRLNTAESPYSVNLEPLLRVSQQRLEPGCDLHKGSHAKVCVGPKCAHHSVVKLPDTLVRGLQRRVETSIAIRHRMRCAKISLLRLKNEAARGAVLIDASTDSALRCEDNCVYDLFAENDEDDFSPEGFWQGTCWGSPSLAEREESHDWEMVAAPPREMWETVMLDHEAPGYATVRRLNDDTEHVVVDGEYPEGLDNYIYYDHRCDDEYDSNADDLDHLDYPDESSSGDEGYRDVC